MKPFCVLRKRRNLNHEAHEEHEEEMVSHRGHREGIEGRKENIEAKS